MGNSKLTCANAKSIIVLNKSMQNTSPPCYKPILLKLGPKSKNLLAYLPMIDFAFCKEFSIGPYFLTSIPNLFQSQFDTIPILTQLYQVTNYRKYISNNNPSQIDYEMLFNSIGIRSLSKLPNLNDIILFCPSQSFRIPLYCIRLSKEDVIPKNNPIAYSEEHIDMTNEQGIKVQRQIELDLKRTSFKYPVLNEALFLQNFRRLLHEIACRDQSLSYVQGMNFIAAFILMFTGNQVELSTAIFLKLLNWESELFKMPFRCCYTENFLLLTNYKVQFRDMLLRYEKEIYDKMIMLDVDEYLWAMKWFQTLFVLNFQFELVMKLWDIIFSKGIDVIVIIAMSITSFYKKKILKCEAIEDVLLLFSKMNSLTINQNKELFFAIVSDVIEQRYIL